MIADEDIDEDVTEALKLRQQLAKSSVKKYQAMQTAVCKDGRARGMFQFYGAKWSDRWAGRIRLMLLRGHL
jgi:DNA polymerase